MSSSTVASTDELTIKERYRDPFIAMTFLAVLFFIILIVIVVIWCIKRRQTEVKTVVIQPKRRPQTVTAKPKPQTNSQQPEANGSSSRDIEAAQPAAAASEAINTDEIELSDDSNTEHNKPPATGTTTTTTPTAAASTESELTHQSHTDTEVNVDTESTNPAQETDTAPLSPPSGDWQMVDKGETNPTFEKSDDE